RCVSFFQAEDGIRDRNVTGVQTCALPIYSHLLEKHQFRVVFAQHFDRPTTLADGIDWLDYWLDSFADDFFPELTETEKRAVYEKIKKHLAPTLYIDDHWQIDYKRLRIIATK